MKYQEAMIAWTSPADHGRGVNDPTAGKLKVVQFGENGPIPPGSGREFSKTMGACDAAVQRLQGDMILTKVLADFVHLVRDERIEPARVHRAFMEIDEYREIYLAQPMIGPARSDDTDPRVEWQGGEIAIADLPTWDEAVAIIKDRADRLGAGSEGDRLRKALLDAISIDVFQGRHPRVEVQGLRLGIEVAGLINLDEAFEVAKTAAEAMKDYGGPQ